MNNVVVIGSHRAGTSMVMQSLYISGYPVLGEKFPVNMRKEINPDGFYEIGILQIDDILPMINGVALKHFPKYMRSDYHEITKKVFAWSTKIILIKRDLSEICRSQVDNDIYGSADRCMNSLLKEHSRFSEIKNCLTINYEDVLTNPIDQLTAMFRFVDFTPRQADFDLVVSNIRRA